MINIRTIRKLADNDGLTLKNGNIIRYKSGWQVATRGYIASTPEQAILMLRIMTKAENIRNIGVWYSDGLYYIDESYRVDTKKDALTIGREYDQQSIYGWKNSKLAWC